MSDFTKRLWLNVPVVVFIIFVIWLAQANNADAATREQVASFAAGKPVAVACDVETNNPLGDPRVQGWTRVGSSELHLRLPLCNYLTLNPRSTVPGDLPRFVYALTVLLHESFHARGVVSEACANTYTQLISFDVLRRFYGVSFFTALSWQVGGMMNQNMLKQSANYHPVCP